MKNTIIIPTVIQHQYAEKLSKVVGFLPPDVFQSVLDIVKEAYLEGEDRGITLQTNYCYEERSCHESYDDGPMFGFHD